jgi:hypothetical protein
VEGKGDEGEKKGVEVHEYTRSMKYHFGVISAGEGLSKTRNFDFW